MSLSATVTPVRVSHAAPVWAKFKAGIRTIAVFHSSRADGKSVLESIRLRILECGSKVSDIVEKENEWTFISSTDHRDDEFIYKLRRTATWVLTIRNASIWKRLLSGTKNIQFETINCNGSLRKISHISNVQWCTPREASALQKQIRRQTDLQNKEAEANRTFQHGRRKIP